MANPLILSKTLIFNRNKNTIFVGYNDVWCISQKKYTFLTIHIQLIAVVIVVVALGIAI